MIVILTVSVFGIVTKVVLLAIGVRRPSVCSSYDDCHHNATVVLPPRCLFKC